MSQDTKRKLTPATLGNLEVDGGELPQEVQCGAADGDDEIGGALAVCNARAREHRDEHHSAGDEERLYVCAEEECSGAHADFHIVFLILACVYCVCAPSGYRLDRRIATLSWAYRRALSSWWDIGERPSQVW